mmetsp:Transcript_23301/g.62967  ORF Transcript_23301/g.62967 Transcript_23301/m.62967 type:complete len:269 (-) Transcript_23301:331-1137(-)
MGSPGRDGAQAPRDRRLRRGPRGGGGGRGAQAGEESRRPGPLGRRTAQAHGGRAYPGRLRTADGRGHGVGRGGVQPRPRHHPHPPAQVQPGPLALHPLAPGAGLQRAGPRPAGPPRRGRAPPRPRLRGGRRHGRPHACGGRPRRPGPQDPGGPQHDGPAPRCLGRVDGNRGLLCRLARSGPQRRGRRRAHCPAPDMRLRRRLARPHPPPIHRGPEHRQPAAAAGRGVPAEREPHRLRAERDVRLADVGFTGHGTGTGAARRGPVAQGQ